ncbi:MAG: class I tRNA ligase family protein [Euryarchaeota archaeon]|nr:class I tRNA ligase family protein [Euryarchaeota archaeon]
MSRLQQRILETNESLSLIRTRHALQSSFFLLLNDVRWYQRRGGTRLLYDILDIWVRLMAPFTPHLCEEIWSNMGHGVNDPISLTSYPVYDEMLVDSSAELSEDLVSSTLSDIEEIIKVTGITPTKAILYTSASWKIKAYRLALSMQMEGDLNPGTLIKTLMSDPDMRKYGKEVPKFAKKLVNDVMSMKEEMIERLLEAEFDALKTLQEAASFFEDVIGCPVDVFGADDAEYDPENKARFAIPMRPAIYLE